MKRLVAWVLSMLMMTMLLSACGNQPAPDATDATTQTTASPDHARFDAALSAFLRLRWQNDPTAVDGCATSGLWTYLQSQGYASAEEVKAYIAAERQFLQEEQYGEMITAFDYTVTKAEQLTTENTAAYLATFPADYGTPTEVHYVTITSSATGENGSPFNAASTTLTLVNIDDTFYVAEGFDLVIDHAYQLWTVS